jgi:hypothetical protein
MRARTFRRLAASLPMALGAGRANAAKAAKEESGAKK